MRICVLILNSAYSKEEKNELLNLVKSFVRDDQLALDSIDNEIKKPRNQSGEPDHW